MTTTLREIEQETARRVGPFFVQYATSGTNGALTAVNLQSSLDLGDWPEAYVLRRGRYWNATNADPTIDAYQAIATFSANDRVRRVAIDGYAPGTGTLTVDRPYDYAPIQREEFELHNLHPAQELRVAVLRGLARTYFVDRPTVTLTGAATERDLTAVVPWITDASQVLEVYASYTGSLVAALPVPWFRPWNQGGHVWLAASPDVYPNSLLIEARRPHFSYVNGASSTTGPTADEDTLTVDLFYATAAAVVECWLVARPKLAAAAAAGLAPSLQEAVGAFEGERTRCYKPPKMREQMPQPFSMSTPGTWRRW